MRKTILANNFNFICGPQHENQLAKPCKTIEDAITGLQKIIDIQCSDGNWNYAPYMHGLANGLIMSLSVLDGKEPKFLNAPKTWLEDKPKSESKLGPVTTVASDTRAFAINALSRANKALATDPISLQDAYTRVCRAMVEDPEYAKKYNIQF